MRTSPTARDQAHHAEAGRQPLETPCGYLPVGIAARSFQQRYLALRTFQKGMAKVDDQHWIVTDSRSEGRIQGTGIIGHRSEEHTSELQSLMRISYAVFCLKKNTKTQTTT